MSQVLRSETQQNHLRGQGDPNLRSDLQEVCAAKIGATWARSDGGSGSALYVCTKRGTPATGSTPGVVGTWVAIA
jgi:hypothetical protein